jgi:hypothetical protein
MKKFNFGKIFALLAAAVAIFAFAFAGCEQANDAVKSAGGAPGNQERGGNEEVPVNGDDDPVLGSPPPAGGITANIIFLEAGNNPQKVNPSIADRAEASETWNMNVLEPANNMVYFAARKTAGQTIKVTGPDAALVTAYDNDYEIYGDTANATRALFAVNACKPHNGKFAGGATRASDGKTGPDVYDEWYDSTFEGDDFNFTLTVTETGKGARTVNVNLRHSVKNEAAVFIARYDGENFTGLERVTGIKRYNGITKAGSNGHTVNFTGDAGTRLIDMLVHVDYYLDTSVEYLVRITADERIPKVVFTYPTNNSGSSHLASYGAWPGKIRLRGTGSAARVIEHDGTAATNNEYIKYVGPNHKDNTPQPLTGGSFMVGFINIARGTLQLEKNITIKGSGKYDGSKYGSLINLFQGHLIMKDGAALTNNDTLTASSGTIYVTPPNNLNTELFPMFTMEGGEIYGNKGKKQTIYIPIRNSSIDPYIAKTGGRVYGNKDDKGQADMNQITMIDNNVPLQ